MQPRIMDNFRKRAKSYGYLNIKIKCTNKEKKIYSVTAIDPLSGTRVYAHYELEFFDKLLRHGASWNRIYPDRFYEVAERARKALQAERTEQEEMKNGC